MSTQQKVLVFYASNMPNEKNEVNWHEFVNVPNLHLATLQKLVGGYISLLPYEGEQQTKYVVYVDEEGLLKRNIGKNYLAASVLEPMGFKGVTMPEMIYLGNVVILREDDVGECGLDYSDVAFWESEIQKAKTKYRGASVMKIERKFNVLPSSGISTTNFSGDSDDGGSDSDDGDEYATSEDHLNEANFVEQFPNDIQDIRVIYFHMYGIPLPEDCRITYIRSINKPIKMYIYSISKLQCVVQDYIEYLFVYHC